MFGPVAAVPVDMYQALAHSLPLFGIAGNT
jgi:hypothetical protein